MTTPETFSLIFEIYIVFPGCVVCSPGVCLHHYLLIKNWTTVRSSLSTTAKISFCFFIGIIMMYVLV